ncbi:MAG TPA: hypothetical protein VJ892_03980 [Candidatus Absconditabacterales bacterium]|nr:hypothetical protein [Candidatus Absconditabacterales bacterium]
MAKLFQDQFLEELILKAGFKEEDIDLIKDDLKPILQERVMIYVYKAITEEQSTVVGNLLGQSKFEELNEYLESVIPNFEDFQMEIYSQFEDEYLENMKE